MTARELINEAVHRVSEGSSLSDRLKFELKDLPVQVDLHKASGAIVYVDYGDSKTKDTVLGILRSKGLKIKVKSFPSAYGIVANESVNEIIRKVGDKYQVRSKDGSKLLGTHGSRAGAEKQLAAIEISKHAHGG